MSAKRALPRGLVASVLLVQTLAGCGLTRSVDLRCGKDAKKVLQQLEGAVVPFISRGDIGSIERLDGCGSGDNPTLTVSFREGVSRAGVEKGLAVSPWRPATAVLVERYGARMDSNVYERPVASRRVVVMVEESPLNQGAVELTAEFFD
ncbi:hypothetical protein [Actinomadura luteofluorescens]|uniref:hypothetical protein n=1 Tax=Actinomadura luteofluorescens TaxID=46163 RepID=UPI003D8DEE41